MAKKLIFVRWKLIRSHAEDGKKVDLEKSSPKKAGQNTTKTIMFEYENVTLRCILLSMMVGVGGSRAQDEKEGNVIQMMLSSKKTGENATKTMTVGWGGKELEGSRD
ncbi:hypothetical protein QE152_g26589 [Popillia japonica]|uniref:Uncharacterized protein n=1 Tax=Popillia japonica TaxID=7064 RepID=A0AAW1JY75_POPJA